MEERDRYKQSEAVGEPEDRSSISSSVAKERFNDPEGPAGDTEAHDGPHAGSRGFGIFP